MDRGRLRVGAVRTAAGELERRGRYPGRRRAPDRKVLYGTSFVLHAGLRWECLSRELGLRSGRTCRRGLAEGHAAGVLDRLLRVLPAELHAGGKLNWLRAVGCSSHVRALKGDPTEWSKGLPPPHRQATTYLLILQER